MKFRKILRCLSCFIENGKQYPYGIILHCNIRATLKRLPMCSLFISAVSFCTGLTFNIQNEQKKYNREIVFLSLEIVSALHWSFETWKTVTMNCSSIVVFRMVFSALALTISFAIRWIYVKRTRCFLSHTFHFHLLPAMHIIIKWVQKATFWRMRSTTGSRKRGQNRENVK